MGEFENTETSKLFKIMDRPPSYDETMGFTGRPLKRKPGREPKIKDEELSPKALMAREKRRKRNKDAAARSRQERKNKTEQLEKLVRKLTAEILNIEQGNGEIREKISQLKNILQMHGCAQNVKPPFEFPPTEQRNSQFNGLQNEMDEIDVNEIMADEKFDQTGPNLVQSQPQNVETTEKEMTECFDLDLEELLGFGDPSKNEIQSFLNDVEKQPTAQCFQAEQTKQPLQYWNQPANFQQASGALPENFEQFNPYELLQLT